MLHHFNQVQFEDGIYHKASGTDAAFEGKVFMLEAMALTKWLIERKSKMVYELKEAGDKIYIKILSRSEFPFAHGTLEPSD